MAKRPPCVGSSSFDPATRIADADARTQALALLDQNDFAGAIKLYFQLSADDKYVYHAITAVTLPQVQHVVSLGGANGLHSWYSSLTTPTTPLDPPPKSDIDAYTTIFLPSTLTPSALKALASNAKKGSIRASVAAHLAAKRYLHPAAVAQQLHIGKKKPTAKDVPPNPYYDFWEWSCRNLEWCGPCPEAEKRPQSHHVLPVLMHHFGCAVPSYESLEILKVVADGRAVVDMGSGNGYWAFMLRQHGVDVKPVDNAQSEWRANWVSDTTIIDGPKWLTKNAAGKDVVLLMVYPVVGGGAGGGVEGGFTRDLIKAYQGDTVAVVGTQNRNGYTSFREMTFDEYMEREQPEWTKVVQIPVPSFAGKDEALFIYQRGERAKKLGKAENAEA
ncbi:hypothetical protein N0V82_010657 [Gnomoniopsis sp. IMI 355080]|nr:hypothetical protein N0V82_010657 [Gnomoniopsis sp. IMI 355080]